VPTFHVALEDIDGRIVLVPLTADDPPAVGDTITLQSGARAIVERLSSVDDVALYHAKRVG
jgi:hypothetical protein